MSAAEDFAEGMLSAGLREVRALGAAESPWPGVLVRCDDGSLRVAVDADLLPADWPGWSSAGEHLLAAREVVRTREGHRVLLPSCVQTVAGFLDRRTQLRVGEAVTLGVSVLRGAREAGEDAIGCWWLAEGGRPVLAVGAGRACARAGGGELLERAAGACGDAADALVAAAAVLHADSPDDRAWDGAETALFDLADAAPLAVAGPAGPARTQPVPADDSGPLRPGWLEHAVRHVDADLADLVSRVTTGLWRRLRAPSPDGSSRRRAWTVAGAAACAVLMAGVLWPGDGGTDGEAVAAPSSSPSFSASAEPALAPSPAAVPETSGGGSGEEPHLAAIADGLLIARRECGADPECLTAVVADPRTPLAAGAVDLPPAERTIALVDSYGGAAVLRVQPRDTRAAAQYVVIVRQNGSWLLRDAYDVAQQP